MQPYVVIRGGGDLASGVAFRLFKAGVRLLILELPAPQAVRRLVSFSEAVFDGEITVEGIKAVRIDNAEPLVRIWKENAIPVLVDPEAKIIQRFHPVALIDARMTKRSPANDYPAEWPIIGLGPGFTAGENCDAAVETMRGPFLGRVYWQGSTAADTGIPENIGGQQTGRVLRAPAAGRFTPLVRIGDCVQTGCIIGQVDGSEVRASFTGVVRGLLRDGTYVQAGMKIGDLDPRLDLQLWKLISEKSLAIGGGVLEALLTIEHVRNALWASSSL